MNQVEQRRIFRFEKRGRELDRRGEAKHFTVWSRSKRKKPADFVEGPRVNSREVTAS